MERAQMCETECVAIAKMEMSGRCNHAGLEIHTNPHTTKRVENVTEEGSM
jgi:hypothetical protein